MTSNRFAVALSFPGEKRKYVKKVADLLAEEFGKGRVLYDHFYKVEFALIALDVYLPDLYRKDSDLNVLFLCKEYSEKDWCGLEWRAIRELVKQRKYHMILPLRFDNAEIEGFYEVDGYIDISKQSPEQTAADIIERHRQNMGAPHIDVPSDDDPFAGILTPELPDSIGEFFKGRDRELKKLRKKLAQKGSAAITAAQAVFGTGGIGKTRLAIEFAHEEMNNYDAVYFVPAESRASLYNNLVGLAFKMGLPEAGDTDQLVTFQAVLRQLKAMNRWLMILDNVDDEEAQKELYRLLPHLKSGDVLITSRIREWRPEVSPFPVEQIPLKDAVAYLMEKTEALRVDEGSDRELAERLARELECFPIALEQAAAYMNHQCIGFADYMNKLEASKAKILGTHYELLQNYPKSVLAAWEATEEKLCEGSRAVLRLASFMSQEPIPRGLFEDNPKGMQHVEERLFSEEETPSNSPLEMGRIGDAPAEFLAELAKWSMIKLDVKEKTLQVHRLVQDATRLRIPEEERTEWLQSALQLSHSYEPQENPDDIRSWPYWTSMEPHLLTLIERAEEAEAFDPTSVIMNNMGLYYNGRARYEEAEPLHRHALKIDEKSFGPDHPEVAIRLNNLALLLKATNRLAEAEPLYRRALEIDEKSFGPDHPEVAIRLNNLALLLQDTNRPAEAEPLMRRALEIWKDSLGVDHPQVATCLNNLAHLLQATNRLAEAEPLMRRALEIDEKALGPDHPNVARDLNNLALLLGDTNRYEETEPLMRRALDIWKDSLGVDHPQVAMCLNNLAALLQATNRLAEAEPFYRRALEIDEKSFGPDHPEVATDLNNLAALLMATGKPEEGLPMMEKALEIWEKGLGPEHPNTITAKENLEIIKKALK